MSLVEKKNMINERIKNGTPIFIAEIGLNHNGKLKEAEEMICAAAESGADAVKFQTFNPLLMNSPYTEDLLQNGRDSIRDSGITDFLSQFVLADDEYRLLKDRAAREGVTFFSSPFDSESLSFLEELDVPMYKVASSEVTNIPLLKKISGTGKPVLMSTGMSNTEELDRAVSVLQEGNSILALLHCVSLYPLEGHEANLNRIASLKNRYGLPAGISDHSRDLKTTVYAALLGARIFERHFMLSEKHDCPDREVSLTPEQFSKMKEEILQALPMAGTGEIGYEGREADTARAAKRSIFASKDIRKGESLSSENLVCLRPGTGIPAGMLEQIEGSTAITDIGRDSILKYEHFTQGEKK